MKPSIPLHWRASISLMKRVPKSLLSRVFGRFADMYLPGIMRKPVLGLFSKIVGIDLSEVEKELNTYPSLNAFFVRKLKAGLRPMPEDASAIVSPVDGRIAEWGAIEEYRLIQAKGIHYLLNDLVDDPDEAKRFVNGHFITIYLSPKDYHRIHTPVSGELDWARCIPGSLFPVNAPAVALVPDLFARNERLVATMDSPMGRAGIVAVGAFNVGRISSAFDPGWNHSHRAVTNHGKTTLETRTYNPPIGMSRGDEIMAFHLGSTVVLLFEPGSLNWSPNLVRGMSVKLGQELGTMVEKKQINPA